jgi:hypothetical protein
MDTRNSERDLDRPSEKGRVAGDRRHRESPYREAPIGELEAIGISGILGTSDSCTSKMRTAKSRWRVWSRAYGSGHLDQGLVKGLARKEPSGIGKSRVPWTQTSCHRERRNSDGGFDYGHTEAVVIWFMF